MIMIDEDHAVLEHYVPFCPKCGNECDQKELRRALDTENWKKIIIETIFYCKKCDNYWSDGLVVKGYK
jgi:C4-type Zn-finger protein